jgi:RNA polymerase sigma-70 factor, ECF subfamily
MLAMGPTNADSGRERSAPPARAGAGAPGHVGGGIGGSGSPPPAVDFAAEYQRAYRVLWVVAAGVLGRSAGAEDVVQEAAVLALGKLEQFQPGTHFAAWMAQMVRFVALNQIRKQARGHAAPLDDTDPAGHGARHPARPAGEPELRLGPRGEVPAGQRSFDDRLTHALAGLGDVARGCLLLRTLEGLDYEEIGRVMDIPQGTAMSHVHRSRMRLRQMLSNPHLRRGSGMTHESGDDEEATARP